MDIAIDIRTIRRQRSGVGYYVTNLIEQLRAIDNTNNYCLITNDPDYSDQLEGSPNFENCYTRVSNENHLIGDIWENTKLPVELSRRGVDIFHGPAFMIPLYKGKLKTVATIHDIVSFILPETIPKKYGIYMRLLIKQVVKRADKIISVSESTKSDLVNMLAAPEDKIVVVPQGVGRRFKPASEGVPDIESVKSKYGITGPFFLFVGNLEPRKNLIRIMKAFEAAKGRLGSDIQLVICGKKGWLYNEILTVYQKIGRENEIVLTNYIDEDDLLKLYQSAIAFVFPTLYEGFGMPVLEAMACGTPVIASNISSFPEICGDSAIMVDPYDISSIKNAMTEIGLSEHLRTELKEKGIDKAAKYTWLATAQKTLDVYQSLSDR